MCTGAFVSRPVLTIRIGQGGHEAGFAHGPSRLLRRRRSSLQRVIGYPFLLLPNDGLPAVRSTTGAASRRPTTQGSLRLTISNASLQGRRCLLANKGAGNLTEC